MKPDRITDIPLTATHDVSLRSVYCIPVHGTSLIHTMIIRSDYCLVLQNDSYLSQDICVTFCFLVLSSCILCFPLSCVLSDYNSRARLSCLVLPDANNMCTRSDSTEWAELKNLKDKTYYKINLVEQKYSSSFLCTEDVINVYCQASWHRR
jgi:hypothetical protein